MANISIADVKHWIKGHIIFLFLPFTEGYVGTIQVWCRLSAFPSGQQAEICLTGRYSVDQAGPSDCSGCRCGE